MKQLLEFQLKRLMQMALGMALIGVLVSACSLTSASSTATPVVSSQGVTPLPGSSHSVGEKPPALGALVGGVPLPQNQIRQLTFDLLYNDAAMEQDVAQMYTPGSATYRQFLTPAQIVQRYGESDAQIDVVRSWLTSNGYTIVGIDAMHQGITVQAPVSAIEKSLGIQWESFPPSGPMSNLARHFIMQIGTPTIKGQAAGLVQAVLGLETYALPIFKPPFSLARGATSQHSVNCTGYGANQSLTRSNLSSVYQVNTLYGQGYQGQGMTIGVAEFDEPYDINDVNNYAQCANGKLPHIQNVQVDSAVAAGSGEGEAALDLELIAGQAPQAQILDYIDGSNNGAISFAQQLIDVFNQVASDRRVQVLSVSYGTGDGQMTQSEQDAVNNSLRNLAAEGISVFVSSGDCGAYSQRLQHIAMVSFPASAPYAIAVGGTHLQVTSSNTRASEDVWGDDDGAPYCQNEWGSGGGVSQNTDFKRPSWQSGTGVDNQYDGLTSAVFTANLTPVQAPNGLRQVPDVAAAAYPNLSIYFQGSWMDVGGTSAAAPIWAAGALLVDQGLQSHSKSLLGGVPTFYTLANHHGSLQPYTDITSGNNLFYPATRGWDYSTGWGAPNFNQILMLELQ